MGGPSRVPANTHLTTKRQRLKSWEISIELPSQCDAKRGNLGFRRENPLHILLLGEKSLLDQNQERTYLDVLCLGENMSTNFNFRRELLVIPLLNL